MGDELDVLLHDDGPECFGDFLEDLPQAERRVLELELVGLDLRKVQDVVEDAQQVPGRRVSDSDELLRLAGRSASSARPVMLRIAFIGVRISWLMLARNIDLVSVASSALILASFNACS